MAKYITRTIEENEVHYTIDGEESVDIITGKFNRKAFIAGMQEAYPDALIKVYSICPIEGKYRMLESEFVKNAERVVE